MMAAEGIEIDRSTLANLVGFAAFELRPVYERLIALLKSPGKLFADETRCPVLEPGRGKTKTGFLWAIARDDRPWAGADPPAVAYMYAPGRSGEHAARHLAGFSGTLQVDAVVYKQLLIDPSALVARLCLLTVERSIKPLPLNRKNALFAGSDEGAESWACIASLVECCKLNHVNPRAWMTEALLKLINRWPACCIDELMPWSYAKASDRPVNV